MIKSLLDVFHSLHRPRLQPAETLAAHHVLSTKAIPLRLNALMDSALIADNTDI